VIASVLASRGTSLKCGAVTGMMFVLVDKKLNILSSFQVIVSSLSAMMALFKEKVTTMHGP
jgi:hypothetical protein